MAKGSGKKSGPPLAHPKAAGLEAVVAQAVKDELRRRGSGGGGDSSLIDRVNRIESRLAVIENTMVTGETLQKELGDLKTQVSKVPFELIKWQLGIGLAITGIVLGILKYLG